MANIEYMAEGNHGGPDQDPTQQDEIGEAEALAEKLRIPLNTYNPVNLKDGKSYKAKEYESVLVSQKDFQFLALIPKDHDEKTSWVRGLMASIEKSEEDVAKDPLIVRQFNEMQAILTHYSSYYISKNKMAGQDIPSPENNSDLKKNKELYDEIEARVSFYQAYEAFDNITRDAETFIKEVASKVDFKQLNFLLRIPEIRAFLTYYQENGKEFDHWDPNNPKKDSLEKVHKLFREKALEEVKREANKYHIAEDSPNLDWAARLAERFWQITGSRVTQMWVDTPEEQRQKDDDDWKKEIQKAEEEHRKRNENKKPKEQYYYDFAPGIATGNDVLRKILRMKEWCLFKEEAPNLNVIWDPLMDYVDLGQRDFISQIISRGNYIYSQTGEDIFKAIIDKDGHPIEFVPPQRGNETQEEYDKLYEKFRKDYAEYLIKIRARLNFSSNKVDWSKIDFQSAIQGSSMGHWAATRIVGVDNARKVLMEKPDSFLRHPDSKSFGALGDSFNYQKGLEAFDYPQDEEGSKENIGKALIIKAQLLINFCRFLESPKARSMGYVKPNSAGLDAIIQNSGRMAQLDQTTIDTLKREIIGTGFIADVSLFFGYFPPGDAIWEFLKVFISGFFKASFSTK